MAIVRWSVSNDLPGNVLHGAVTVGNFDGVHRGHGALLQELRRQCGVGEPAVVLTFDPHPLAVLAPERLKPLLTSPDQRAELLIASGADHVVIAETTPALLGMNAEDFLSVIVRDGLKARAMVEGYDFHFGRGRAGTNATIRDWGVRLGVRTTVVEPYSYGGQVVSSSKVRHALESGDVTAAAMLLGRRYRLTGDVLVGARRGRTIGFPTANMERTETLVPGDGVYAVIVRLPDGSQWPAAANVGPNPTFGDQARKVEVHVIGFTGDLYGAALTIEFVDRLRETRMFASVADLTAQLRIDVATAAEHLKMQKVPHAE
ncbi:MAG: bifunctional riboflavin kinase/FAD synthetase [Gemmataceae bacterium]